MAKDFLEGLAISGFLSGFSVLGLGPSFSQSYHPSKGNTVCKDQPNDTATGSLWKQFLREHRLVPRRSPAAPPPQPRLPGGRAAAALGGAAQSAASGMLHRETEGGDKRQVSTQKTSLRAAPVA